MKKRFCAVMAFLICFALFMPLTAAAEGEGIRLAIATNNAIVVSNSPDTPDAHVVHPAVYKIEGSNYFKLRDVAMLLNGSARQFAVDYDDASRAVLLSSGKPYAAKGGELSGTAAESAGAIVSNNTIFIDGEPVALEVFKIDGANYFKLRDLGEALDFYVGYDENMKIVYISGARGYEKEADPAETDEISFTAKYIRTNGYHESVTYPAVTLIGDPEALARYYEENRTLYDLSAGFSDAIQSYDEAWFAAHQLLLVLLEEGSGSIRHRVTKVTAGEDPAVEIDVLVPEVGTADMAQWHILIETERVFDAADEIEIRLNRR